MRHAGDDPGKQAEAYQQTDTCGMVLFMKGFLRSKAGDPSPPWVTLLGVESRSCPKKLGKWGRRDECNGDR